MGRATVSRVSQGELSGLSNCSSSGREFLTAEVAKKIRKGRKENLKMTNLYLAKR
jgi:hypothetical protein